MSEGKHTPGPWEWEGETLYGKDDGYTGEVLCDAYFPEENEREKYDRALIEAAPDLLRVLKMAQVWLEFDGRFDMQGINAAIAKAEGKCP